MAFGSEGRHNGDVGGFWFYSMETLTNEVPLGRHAALDGKLFLTR